LNFSSASSLKQQFEGRRVTALQHIILIPSQLQVVYSLLLLLRKNQSIKNIRCLHIIIKGAKLENSLILAMTKKCEKDR
jgi:hypothetical protein